MSYYGCTFKGKHSYKDFKLIMRSEDRSLLPQTKVSQVDIPFIDGKFDMREEPVYDNRTITVTFTYADMSLEDMHLRKRLVAGWLSGKGQLIFDDEPNKYYEATVFEKISFNQELGKASFSVVFECKPFAMQVPIIQSENITRQNQEVVINILGNVRTGGKLTLTNVGTTTINEIKLSRERGKD